MTQQSGAVLERNRRSAGLTHNELWLRYFALGGMSSALELEDILSGIQEATPEDHNVIAHALNERFVELGGKHPIPYTDDEDDEA